MSVSIHMLVFFDHEWAQKFGDTNDRSKLRLPALDLTRDWKGIAVATRMPWLMIESLKGFHDAFTKTNPPFYKRLTVQLGEYIAKQFKIRNMLKKELLSALDKMRGDVEQEMERAGPSIDRDKLWH